MCQVVEAEPPPRMRAWLVVGAPEGTLLRFCRARHPISCCFQHPIHFPAEEVVEAVQPPLPRTPLPVEAPAG